MKAYFIQYKFIIPEGIKHSSYTYQKLFRALYGYTQAVYKSSGRTYHYHREGVLSSMPYIRPGKNCVIIEPSAFQRLIEFFKTGKNPAHNWRGKGEWKAVYYMNEKEVNEKEVIEAVEKTIDRKYVFTKSKENEKLFDEMNLVCEKGSADKALTGLLLNEAKPLVESEWFRTVHPQSKKLGQFYRAFKRIKSL